MSGFPRWILPALALFACLLLGWYLVIVVAAVVITLTVWVSLLLRLRERRPAEGWTDWFLRMCGEMIRRRRSLAPLHPVLLSCGHRGWIQSHDAPGPGDMAFCCHKRFGPADPVEVLDVGVEMYGFTPTVIRLKEDQPAG